MKVKLHQTNKFLSGLILLTFILGWFVNNLSLPVISIIMGANHKIIIAYENGEKHVIFHHSNDKENNHDFLISNLSSHHNDLHGDNTSLTSIFFNEPKKHHDHEISLPEIHNDISSLAKLTKAERAPPLIKLADAYIFIPEYKPLSTKDNYIFYETQIDSILNTTILLI